MIVSSTITVLKNGLLRPKEDWLGKKGNRKVQGVPQSQTAALPRPQEEEKTNLNKQKPNKRTKITKISSLFPKRGNRNTRRTEKQEQSDTRKDIQQIAS